MPNFPLCGMELPALTLEKGFEEGGKARLGFDASRMYVFRARPAGSGAQSTPSSSTSKCSTALGGITPPAPRRP